MSKIDLVAINAGLGTVSTALPLLMAAYEAYHVIWSAVNPGKTEQDFLDALTAASQSNVDLSSAILKAHGYVQAADGSWTKPPATA